MPSTPASSSGLAEMGVGVALDGLRWGDHFDTISTHYVKSSYQTNIKSSHLHFSNFFLWCDFVWTKLQTCWSLDVGMWLGRGRSIRTLTVCIPASSQKLHKQIEVVNPREFICVAMSVNQMTETSRRKSNMGLPKLHDRHAAFEAYPSPENKNTFLVYPVESNMAGNSLQSGKIIQ